MRPVASPLFQGLSAEEWAALEQSGCLRAKSYPRHAVIFHAGAQVHALGVVLRGTVHIENLDPEFEGMPILRKRHDGPLKHVMSNSFGFGGTNGCLILSKV